MIDGDVGFLEYRRAFELIRGHLVVPGLDRDAEAVGLQFEVFHVFEHAARNGSEIVVVELLVFGRDVPHQRTSGLRQVGTGQKQRFVHQEIFLLPAQRDIDLPYVLVEQLTHFDGGFINGLQRLEQRRFEVERFAGVGDEYAGDTECPVENERGRRRVPSRITARFERVAEASGRETRCVGFLLYEQLAFERFERSASEHRFEEGIVFLGGGVVQRLEPVRIVGCSFFHGPRFHPLGDLVGDLAVDPPSFVDSGAEAFVSFFRDVLTHFFAVEYVRAEIIGYLFVRQVGFYRLPF